MSRRLQSPLLLAAFIVVSGFSAADCGLLLRNLTNSPDEPCPMLGCRIACPNGRAEDANGCSTCECNPTPVGCSGLSESSCNTHPGCKPIYADAPAPYSGAGSNCMPNPYPSTYVGCEDAGYCPMLGCACQYGNQYDANGCLLGCECDDPVVCPALACLTPCQYGPLTDENGCTTCQCNPEPEPSCGPVCAIWCEFGNVVDESGCPICECSAAP